MRATTRQDWLAAGAVLAALVAVFAIPAATTGASLARAVAAMALGALIALAVARAPFTFALRVRSGFVLLVLLGLWYALTRLWAVEPAGSMFEAARVTAFVLVVWAVHTCVVGTAARRALLAGVAACALYVSAPLLWDVLADGAPDVRVSGELGYWNATAAVALVLVPTAVALAGTGRRALLVVAGVLVPIAGVAATATASRGALVALAVALLVQALLDPDYRGGLPRALVAGASLTLTIVGLTQDVPVLVTLVSAALVAIGGFGLVRARRVRRDRIALHAAPAPDPAAAAASVGPHRPPRAARAVGALIVLALAALLVALVVDSNEGEIPVPAGTTSDASRLTSTDDSERLTWYREALDMWTDRPIVGQGGDAFDALRVDVAGLAVQHVHSMPLEVLLETGLVGALMLAAATVLLLRVLRQGHRSPERALAGAICALVLVQALVDWTLALPPVLVLLAIAGPIALTRPPDPDDDAAPTAPARVPTWAALTMLGTLAIATTIAFTPVLATLLADQAAKKFDDGKYAQAADLSAQSLQLVPALDTLTLQVISLQAQGDDDAVRATLREHEQVWSGRLDGLYLARQHLADDRELGPIIERRIAQKQDEQAERLRDLA